MPRNSLVCLCCLSLVFTAALLGQAPAKGTGSTTVTGSIRVIDGDTLDVHINGKEIALGLLGIDAPMGNSDCGKQATALLQSLVKNGLHLDEDLSFTLDSRKRRLYYALTPDGKSVASAL